MARNIVLSLVIILGAVGQAAAQATVFIVRHAERADTAGGAAPAKGADPDLSDAGRARAVSLAGTLKDAGITAIYATEFKRTQQTAAPLANAQGLQITTMPANDLVGLLKKIKAAPGNVLVVGHSDTVPGVIKGLGVQASVKVEDSDFDNLFVVVLRAKPVLVRLHYR